MLYNNSMEDPEFMASPQPESYLDLVERDLVRDYTYIVEKYGPGDPTLLPLSDNLVKQTDSAYRSWKLFLQDRAMNEGTLEAELETKLKIIPFLIDVGFTDTDYVETVIQQQLAPNLAKAEMMGLWELARKYQHKITQLSELV